MLSTPPAERRDPSRRGSSRHGFYRRHGKRWLDLALALPALAALSPLLALAALAVRLRLGRPVLFRQCRPGLAGEPFEILKLRTMRPAPMPGAAPGDRSSDEPGDVADPRTDADRLTPLGAWLRRTSLDELPELWNVVRGDMSLVGPRPLLMRYLPRYSDEQARRHEVKPGLTGWAQIHGRNATDWPRRLALDVWYVDRVSLRLDLAILRRTVAQVLRREGVRAPGHATMPEFRGTETEPAGGEPTGDRLSRNPERAELFARRVR